MSKSPARHYQIWKSADVGALRTLAAQNTPTRPRLAARSDSRCRPVQGGRCAHLAEAHEPVPVQPASEVVPAHRQAPAYESERASAARPSAQGD